MAGDESTTAFATGAGGFCWWLRLLVGLQLLFLPHGPVEALAEGAPRPAMHLVWIDVRRLRRSLSSRWRQIGGTLDDAATSMSLKPSEQEGPS